MVLAQSRLILDPCHMAVGGINRKNFVSCHSLDIIIFVFCLIIGLTLISADLLLVISLYIPGDGNISVRYGSSSWDAFTTLFLYHIY